MPTSGTYSLSSGGVATVTSVAHGLITGQQLFLHFQTVTAGTIQPDSQNTTPKLCTVLTADTFSVSGYGAPSAATGTLQWLATSGATYAQTGKIITVTWTNNGFAAGQYTDLAFVGGTYTKDTNYLIQTTVDSSTFTVTAQTSATTSGGVRVRVSSAAFGTCTPTLSGNFQLVPKFLRATGLCTAQLDGRFNMVPAQRTALGVCRPSLSGGFVVVPITRVPLGTCLASLDGKFVMVPIDPVPVSGTCRASLDWANGASPVLVPVLPATALSLTGIFTLRTTAVVNNTQARYTVTDAIDDAARLAYYQYGAQVSPDKLQRLVDDLNATMTLIFSKADVLDYFNQQVRDYTIPANTNSLSLEADVESINGPVKLTTTQTPLTPLEDLSDIQTWATRHPSTLPTAYFSNRSGNLGVASGYTHTLNFAPVPTVDTAINIEISFSAPVYSVADYYTHTPMEIPKQHAPKILFPILRWHYLSSVDVVLKTEKLPYYEKQNAEAFRALGLTDPMTPSAKKKEAVNA